MITVQVVGVALLGVGTVLFVASQWTGGERSTSDAGLKAWSINVSGPPGLILIVIGIAVFLYPLSPWWPDSEVPEVAPPLTTTTATPETTTTTTTTTTTPPPEVTVSGTWLTTVAAPFDPLIYPPGDLCATTPGVDWLMTDGDYTDFRIWIEAYNELGDLVYVTTWDSAIDEWVFGYDELGRANPAWCLWEGAEPWLAFDLDIAAYGEYGFSDDLEIVLWP